MIDDILTTAAQQTVIIERVTDPVYDVNDVLDEEASTIETEEVPAVISNDLEDDRRRVEGEVPTMALQVTVPSDTDIEVDREGRPDEVVIDGDSYRVDDITEGDHPFADVVKRTATVVRKAGH